ncbi:MAG TPA: hypothetical protein VFE70_07440 [Candidatus Elarobacter sp.]|nr:hypothetical protein [Candidatus Elarobacter sp.]
MERTVTRRAQLTAGLAGGLAGAFLMEAFFRGALWAFKIQGDQLPLLADYVGTTVLSPGSAPGMAAGIAFLLYLAVSAGWGVGYVSASRTSPQLLARPWISGAVFGLVVYIVMQVMLLTAGLYHRPNFDVLLVQLAAYVAGFGIPVAVIASRQLRIAAGSG